MMPLNQSFVVPAVRPPVTVLAAIERDRRIADSLQSVLLRSQPREALPGVSVETFYAAALDEASVGGDSVDAFPLTGDRIALVVADASGKGLDAAERIAEVRFALRAFLREHDDPCRALASLNDSICASQYLCKRDSGSFVTLTLVVLDQRTGALTCLCAGGEPPLVLASTGTVRPIPTRGPALGLYAGLSYEASQAHLQPGDTVLLATDGITEARQYFPATLAGASGSSFLGMEGLVRLVRRAARTGPPCLLSPLRHLGQTVFEGARAFAGGSFHDDACLLVARRDCPVSPRALPERISP
jgi:serine phosphatase RsbU (regulator of sigma subunit)